MGARGFPAYEYLHSSAQRNAIDVVLSASDIDGCSRKAERGAVRLLGGGAVADAALAGISQFDGGSAHDHAGRDFWVGGDADLHSWHAIAAYVSAHRVLGHVDRCCYGYGIGYVRKGKWRTPSFDADGYAGNDTPAICTRPGVGLPPLAPGVSDTSLVVAPWLFVAPDSWLAKCIFSSRVLIDGTFDD